jgi:molybdate transport system substrate-binding protein
VVVACKEGGVEELKDVARPGVKLVLAGDNMPAGRYTAEVLAKMSKDALYGGDFQKRVRVNTASLETGVRSVLMKVVVGEADAGFVYATDAMTVQDKVRVIPIPDRVNQTACYPIAVLAGGAAPEEARKFVALVLGEKGQAVLKARGFLPPQ